MTSLTTFALDLARGSKEHGMKINRLWTTLNKQWSLLTPPRNPKEKNKLFVLKCEQT